MVTYIGPDDLNYLFEVISKYYCRREEIPDYFSETVGIDKLLGVLNGVRVNLYSSVVDKASYLLIQISKDHFFSNGNKRLALVATTVFLIINDMWFKDLDHDAYRKKLTNLFPNFDAFEDDNFIPSEFAIYNLSIIIADSYKYMPDFESLKCAVREFFTYSLTKTN